MSDKKVTQLTALTTSHSGDLLLVIDDPNGTPVSKKMTVKNFFATVPANTTFSQANVTITSSSAAGAGTRFLCAANGTFTRHFSANTLTITKKAAPSSNNSANATVSGFSFGAAGIPVGTVWFSNTFLYIATDATTIKRVALSRF